MKSTKRLLCLLLCAVMVLSLFSGCGGQGEETTPSSSATELTTEATTEATTEPNTEPTEPLPTEILSWTQNDFYIGDSVRTYDRQGNLIKEEKDFHYEDGTSEVGFICFDAHGNTIEEESTIFYASGRKQNYTYGKYDAEGKVLASIDESYDQDGKTTSFDQRIYDEARGLWAVDIQNDYENIHGLFSSVNPCSSAYLVEGTYLDYSFETGTLMTDCLRNADGSGYYYYYRPEDGSVWNTHEYTFDPETNTLKHITFYYAADGSLFDHSEEDNALDSKGNVIKHTDYYFDENNTYTHKMVYEYQYDHNSCVIEQIAYMYDENDLNTVKAVTEVQYDNAGRQIWNMMVESTLDESNLLSVSSESENKFQYDSEGRLIFHREHVTWTEFSTTTETSFEYNAQGLVSKKHVVEVRSDSEIYHSEQFYEYEYNEQGLLTLAYECDLGMGIFGDLETITRYTYDENGQCILVEVAKFNSGAQTSYGSYEPNENGYIYSKYEEQLYPYDDPADGYFFISVY